MTEYITDEAVKKAAALLPQHEYRVASPQMVPYCTCGWSAEEYCDVAAYDEHVARIALEAAAELIAAPAWDEGYAEGGRCRIWDSTNPYERTERAGKKPIIIEARQFPTDGTPAEAHAIYQWVEENTLGSFEPLDVIEGRKPWPESGVTIDPRDGRMVIATLEGGHWVTPGDFIIRGVQGEFYPCREDIFRQTYEPAETVPTRLDAYHHPDDYPDDPALDDLARLDGVSQG